MNISNKDIQGKSPKDLHILFLSEEERKKEKIKTDLPTFTPAEKQALFDSLSLPRLLLLAGKLSLGKTEYNLEKQSNDLKKLQGWIDQISKGITDAQAAKANKEGEVNFSDGFLPSITEMALWAKEKGLTIDIELKTDEFGAYSELKTDPDLLVNQLQNISGTLNAEIKNISTEVQKLQSDSNAFTELMVAIAKKMPELGTRIASSI